ncbi:ethanolamine ammonia-lyase subunit EutC [Nocardia sp. NPDC127526]|uniref:ethanolamine ammonia-lyase subunit EutC n=1 Tax=Nocardia sp. NPDC127526 TaxID=3345393 RepID=UPI003644C9F2
MSAHESSRPAAVLAGRAIHPAGPAPDAAGNATPDAAQDFWAELRRTTQARIGLGRTGDALPTTEVLEFRAAHAAARDAVHKPLDVAALAARISALGLGDPAHVRSRASDRSEYLRRPDLGRLPAGAEPTAGRGGPGRAGVTEDASAPFLAGLPRTGADIGVVLADGLSPRALTDHGAPMLAALIEALGDRYSFAPPVIATQARVALGDHIGETMGVTTLLVLIGERPGLSVADSLGIYLTHLPRPGRADSERNCISNIHPPEGLGYARAAQVAAGLIDGARRLGRSGVDLKDTSAVPALTADPALLLEVADSA